MRIEAVVLALVLSGLGRLVHDLHEFGSPSPDLPVTAVLVPACLAWAWWRWPGRPSGWMLLWWAVVQALGAAFSVLPLPVWPYAPSQDTGHYLAHAAWLATQVPLLVVGVRGARRPGRDATGRAPA